MQQKVKTPTIYGCMTILAAKLGALEVLLLLHRLRDMSMTTGRKETMRGGGKIGAGVEVGRGGGGAEVGAGAGRGHVRETGD